MRLIFFCMVDCGMMVMNFSFSIWVKYVLEMVVDLFDDFISVVFCWMCLFMSL